MSSDKETTDYIELRPGDKVQVWDQWRDQFGQWHFYTHSGNTGGFVDSGVKARRPIWATHQTAYEEVPGSRTTQETIVNPQRERIAYEDLQPGDIIQEGDQWQNECGRWQPFLVLEGSRVQVRQSQRVRRPYNITQLQDEPDELKTALRESHAAHAFTTRQGLAACKERDEARAEVQRLQEVVNNLYNEPTARQVQQMLRTWATELDWSAGCFDSVAREQIDTIQKTLVAVIERIEGMINPEGGSDE